MIELYFSGADKPLYPQTNSELSLGGYISSTILPNGRIDVLFNSLSEHSKYKQSRETKAIFLKNAGSTSLFNLILREIYPDNHSAKFEWSSVLSLNNNQIEKIYSIRDLPYNGEFFEPISVNAFAVVKIIKPPHVGDHFVLMSEIQFACSGNSIESLVNECVSNINLSTNFTAIHKSETEFIIKTKNFNQFEEEFDFLTDGLARVNPVNFSGAIDNGQLILNELKPNQVIGLWISRTALLPPLLTDPLFEDYYNIQIPIKSESLNVIFEWD